MSYDLLLLGPVPAHGDIEAFFTSRPHYTLSENQAWYSNDDTGVYFSFDFLSPDEQADTDPELPRHWAEFTLTYGRPTIFGLEAAIELEAVLERFGQGIYDPQADQTHEGDLPPDAFLRRWSEANRDALSALPPALAYRPQDELERIWTWNYHRNQRQDELGDHIFVPRIGIYRSGDRILSASVWTDAIPIVLPRTDAVILYRDDLAPRRLGRKRPGVALAPWAKVQPLLDGFRTAADPLPHVFLDYDLDARPAAIVSWTKKQRATRDLGEIPMEAVVDEELRRPS